MLLFNLYSKCISLHKKHYFPFLLNTHSPSLIVIIKLSVMDLIIHLHDEWHKLLKSKHKKEKIFMLYDLIGS